MPDQGDQGGPGCAHTSPRVEEEGGEPVRVVCADCGVVLGD